MDALLQLFPILFILAIAYVVYIGRVEGRRHGRRQGKGWHQRNPAHSWRQPSSGTQAPTGGNASPLAGDDRGVQAARERRYRVKPVMTKNEHGFYWQLAKGCPSGYQVFSQVSMGALLASQSQSEEESRSDFYFIAARRVDFVVWRADRNEVLLLVELDDKTHDPERDRARDALTESAGLETWRVQSNQKPSVPEIKQYLAGVIARKYAHEQAASTASPSDDSGRPDTLASS